MQKAEEVTDGCILKKYPDSVSGPAGSFCKVFDWLVADAG